MSIEYYSHFHRNFKKKISSHFQLLAVPPYGNGQKCFGHFSEGVRMGVKNCHKYVRQSLFYGVVKATLSYRSAFASYIKFIKLKKNRAIFGTVGLKGLNR